MNRIADGLKHRIEGRTHDHGGPGLSTRVWSLVAGLVIAVGMAGAAAAAQGADAEDKPKPSTRKECLECHDDPKLKSKANPNKSMTVIGDHFARSAHRRLDCAECHESALTVKHPDAVLGPVSPKVCQECHEEEFAAIAASIHGRRADTERAIKDCAGCHGSMHTVKKGGDPASPLSPINQIKSCGRCHEDVLENYESSEHARALLKSGLTEASASCSSCHGKHDILSKEDKGATTHVSKAPETCGKCHTAILRDWKESSHGKLWKEGKETANCVTCHSPHAVKQPSAPAVRAEVTGECGKCHEKVTATFKDGFHGKATTLQHARSASCSSCHTAHVNLPASDPRSSVHPDNLAKTCGACHADVNPSFLTYDPHANPADPERNLYVHWIYVAMTALLLGVFGFFGLHATLWLQRAIVGRLRGEFGSHHRDGQWIRRFNPMQIAIHVTIMLSFLLLAATGLPLKFAEATWAPGMINFLGGAESAGFLHRVAGVITFGYFAWHLSMLVYGLLVKRERGYFWGPRSMVPQLTDVSDLIKMFKWFLYIGPRPKFDHFTYWEKFDYLAVFWGVAIIGLSGLALWFPTTATTFLPGWALNAAYVMHSDEALLATGFIFLFHFFHTHLRPEAFPMDLVIFLGRMPLEAFKEERTLEYDRLVKEGKLEERLAPAPTAGEIRLAYLFGSAALLTGIVLAVYIFRALAAGLVH